MQKVEIFFECRKTKLVQKVEIEKKKLKLGETIPLTWTRVQVRVEDRIRLRVRFRVGFQKAGSGLCCLVGPGLLEVYLLR